MKQGGGMRVADHKPGTAVSKDAAVYFRGLTYADQTKPESVPINAYRKLLCRKMFRYPSFGKYRFIVSGIKKGNNQHYSLNFQVELAGVEPASKRGSHKLSTCLSPT